MKRILSILFFATVILSCERDVITEGPSLFDQFGPFELLEELEISNRDVDFAQGENTFFTAQFSKAVDWKLTISGHTSGAQKVIIGNSIELNAQNAVWDGSTTVFPMFKEEYCIVDLSVSTSTDNGDTIISIVDSLVSYDNLTVASIKSNDGLLISDFENGFNPNWDYFYQSGVNFNVISNNAPQGNSFYNMAGACSWDWLIGMAIIPATAYGSPTFDLNENADKVYFNVLLNLPEGITNAKLLIRFFEDDDNDGIFEDATEDTYSLWLDDLDYGWQKVSVKYSDMTAIVDGNPADANGNKIHNPDLLNYMDVLLLADPATGFSQVQMDYMIFTEDEPLNP
jgi:hypothetical protein